MTPCKNGQVRDRKTKLCRERKANKGCTKKKCPLYKLHQACRDAGSKGKVDLRSLITKSEEINQLDHDMTPLMILASQGNVEMIDLFVLNNASLLTTNSKNETVLHYANEAGMAKLLTYHDVPVNVVSKDGSTPLHHAIEMNSSLSVKLLLQHGAVILPFSEEGNQIQRAMEIAVSKKNYIVLKTLLPYLDKETLHRAHTEAVRLTENNFKKRAEYKKVAAMIKKVYTLKFNTNIGI